MKIIVNDPIEPLRQSKKERVNANFATIASQNIHVEQAHAQKRIWAATQDERLKPEADLRGITVADLSALILSKPDHAAARELQRQTIMLRIEAATTPETINAI